MEREHIGRVIDYIEAHLKEELDNRLLAEIAGYSEFHFLRLFRESVRLTPADYVRKRRISEIVRRIGRDKRPICDIAFEYGFNSKENFTRAFKKEHKILPTEFRTADCSLRLFQPFDFNKAEICPDVSIGGLKGFSVVAYPCDEELPPGFWNKYNAEKRSARLSGGEVTEDYGVMRWNPEKQGLDYYIGIRAEMANGDISGTVRLNIAGGLYAVFDTPPTDRHSFVDTIRRTWDWIYGVWLPESGYRRGKGFEMECYVESSRKYSERIYVPIEK